MATKKPLTDCNMRIVHRDEEGKWWYPATQRSDGSWRKPIPVRDGYIPEELKEKYVVRVKREAIGEAEPNSGGVIQSQQDTLADSEIASMMSSLSIKTEPGQSKNVDTGVNNASSKPRVPVKQRTLPVMDFFVEHMVPATPATVQDLRPANAASESVKPAKVASAGVKPASGKENVKVELQNSHPVAAAKVQERKEELDHQVTFDAKRDDIKSFPKVDQQELKSAENLVRSSSSDIKSALHAIRSEFNAGILSPEEKVAVWNNLMAKWYRRGNVE